MTFFLSELGFTCKRHEIISDRNILYSYFVDEDTIYMHLCQRKANQISYNWVEFH